MSDRPEPGRRFPVPGVWAYVDSIGVEPGKTVHLHASVPSSYDVTFVKLGTTSLTDPGATVDEHADDDVLTRRSHTVASPQRISPGSYIFVDGPPLPSLPLTLGVWLRLWRPPSIDTLQWNWSGVITAFDYPEHCSFGLLIDHMARPVVYWGDGDDFSLHWLHVPEISFADSIGRWRFLAATASKERVSLFVDGREVLRHTEPPPPASSPTAQLRIGASAEGGQAANFLDADISAPFVASTTLEAADLERLALDGGRTPFATLNIPELAGCWPLDEERGRRVADVSGNGRHGVIVNGATWEIGGPSFDPKLGVAGYEPRRDHGRGHGLRLASDDLVDAEWPAVDEFTVASDAMSGLYAVRIELAGQAEGDALEVPFAVIRTAPRTIGSIALLIATNTWHAYGRIPTDDTRVPGLSSSFYTRHMSGRPFFHLGLRLPIPHARVHGYESQRAARTGHSHLVRPELYAQAWLDAEGCAYECLTDLDLHRHPDALRAFDALLICGHNEYWTDAMREGVDDYLSGGGRVICLSGNTLYWRTSYDPELERLEARKTSASSNGEWLPPSEWGERWHSTDQLPGGTWSLLGKPTHEIIGLEMQGMIDDGAPATFSPFTVLQGNHPLFCKPFRVPLSPSGTIGEMCLNGPKASGYEMDAAPDTVGVVDSRPEGMVVLASAVGQRLLERVGRIEHGADIIYWQRPAGGEVFNAGSIAFSGSLLVDPGVRTLMRNVLVQFAIPSHALEEARDLAQLVDGIDG